MKKIIFCITLLAVLAGCQTPPPAPPVAKMISPDERAAMQTHILAESYDAVFAATIAILQDMDWRLDSVDKPAGLIRATTMRKTEALGPEDERDLNLQTRRATIQRHADVTQKWARWKELVIHTEPWSGGSQTRQRIVMTLRGTLPAMSYQEEQGGTWLHHGRNVLINAPPVEQNVEVDLPEAYRDLFERVEKDLRQRQ